MDYKKKERPKEVSRNLCVYYWKIELNDNDDEAEIIYEEVLVTDDESSSVGSSDEEVEYIYEIEYIEEDEEEKQTDQKEKQRSHSKKQEISTSSKELSKSCQMNEKIIRPILLRDPPVFRKSVSFSSVHSVLTENNDIIFVDEADDIFS